MKEVSFIGQKADGATPRVLRVVVQRGGRRVDPQPLCLHGVMAHRWGELTPVCLVTAEAILAAVLPDAKEARDCSIPFLVEVVSQLHADGWRIDEQEVWDWYLGGVICNTERRRLVRARGVS